MRRSVILYFSPFAKGGLAEYARCQAASLEQAGAKVTCLVAPSFIDGRASGFETVACLCDPPLAGGSWLVRKIKTICQITWNRYMLAWEILRRRPDLVLLDSYLEYLAPFWVWPHWFLARLFGIRYAANLHDPVRNFVIGPAWWHKWSVRLAYLPLDFILVHDNLPESASVPSRVRVVQVPHGLYDISGSGVNADEVRRSWGVKEGQTVFLAFGYVRDDKNLDLAMQALARVPGSFLVVAGSVASGKDKPLAFYRELAKQLGVLDRCHFVEGFVPDEELGTYFIGTDIVLLTYAATFHSQSGVLNVAARARKKVLASSGPGPLIESVRKYQLGIAIEPDSLDAIITGMQQLLASAAVPHWEEYELAASWEANAQAVLRAAGGGPC